MPDEGQLDLEDALRTVADAPSVWRRLAAFQVDGQWQQWTLELTAGEPAPGWRRTAWRYPTALFVADVRKGASVARDILKRQTTAAGQRVTLPEPQAILRWQRVASHANGVGLRVPLDWPSYGGELGSALSLPHPPSDPLIADGAPSWRQFDVAAAAFLGAQLPAGGSVYAGGPNIRFQDLQARISHVSIGTDAVTVRVEGTRLAGVICELAGDVPGVQIKIGRNGSRAVRLPIDGVLPPGSWLVLKRGDRWLDRRYLNVPYFNGEDADVEVELEPGTRLQALVASHEGPTIEFKESLPGDGGDEEARKAMRTVAAFANGDGGTIVFGVDDEEQLVGFPDTLLGPAQETLDQLIEDWLDPHPDYAFERWEIPGVAGRSALALLVRAGHTPPYAAGRPRRRLYYVRPANRTRQATAMQVRQLARSRPPEQPGRFFG